MDWKYVYFSVRGVYILNDVLTGTFDMITSYDVISYKYNSNAVLSLSKKRKNSNMCF